MQTEGDIGIVLAFMSFQFIRIGDITFESDNNLDTSGKVKS